MRITVIPSAPGHAKALLTRGLRPADIREAWKVAGMPPGPALRLTLAGSDMAASIFVDGVIVAMFGVCGPPPLLSAAFLNAPAGPVGPWNDGAGRAGSPAGIFPAEERSKGAPWLLAHPNFERLETAACMGRISRRFINHWLSVFGRLENYADPEHEKSLTYLKWLGFAFDPNPARGPLGHTIIRFWR